MHTTLPTLCVVESTAPCKARSQRLPRTTWTQLDTGDQSLGTSGYRDVQGTTVVPIVFGVVPIEPKKLGFILGFKIDPNCFWWFQLNQLFLGFILGSSAPVLTCSHGLAMSCLLGTGRGNMHAIATGPIRSLQKGRKCWPRDSFKGPF